MKKLSAFTYALLSLILVGNAWGQTNTKGIQFVEQGSAISCPSGTSCMWVNTSQVASLGASIKFTGTTNRTITTEDTTDAGNLTINPGTTSDVGVRGGQLKLSTGRGGPGNGVSAAGPGGDFVIRGGDAGAAGAAGGSTGGNVYIGGGLGTNAVYQHGGILIGGEDVVPITGETIYADEIRIGHKPQYGTINQGHIRHIGYFADSLSIYPADDYTIRFAIKSGTAHQVDCDPQVNDGGAGTAVDIKAGKGGSATASPGAQGGDLSLYGGAGGDGAVALAAGAGADLNLYGGSAGTNNGGGGAAGGHVVIDGGNASGAGNDGQVYVGTDSTRTLATNIGHAAAGTNILGLNNPQFIATNGAQTLKVGDMPTSNTAGAVLKLISGKGNGTGNGGDIYLVGADAGASGTYGGSVIIDGGNGSAAANDGVILIGTNNASPAGGTASVTIGTEGNPLIFNSIPQSASVPTIASAGTIAPVTLVAKVSGTTTVSTITLPYTSFKGTIAIIPTGVFAWDTNGNIALAGTSVVGKTIYFTCDGTNWYPSYT